MKCNYKEQLKIGKKIEMEHAHIFPKSKQIKYTSSIAEDHLDEDPCYYLKLKKVEK